MVEEVEEEEEEVVVVEGVATTTITTTTTENIFVFILSLFNRSNFHTNNFMVKIEETI